MDAPAPVSTHDIADDPRNDAILIHVEAQFVPRSEAPVSVYGSGLMLGDSVWEGLRLYDGHLPFPGDHLDRLCKAARCIALDIGKYRAEPISEIKKPLQHNDMAADVHVRLLVARGRKRKPFQHLHLSIYGPTNLTIAEHSILVDSTIRCGMRHATVPHHRGLPLTRDARLNWHSMLNCIIAVNHAAQ